MELSFKSGHLTEYGWTATFLSNHYYNKEVSYHKQIARYHSSKSTGMSGIWALSRHALGWKSVGPCSVSYPSLCVVTCKIWLLYVINTVTMTAYVCGPIK